MSDSSFSQGEEETTGRRGRNKNTRMVQGEKKEYKTTRSWWAVGLTTSDARKGTYQDICGRAEGKNISQQPLIFKERELEGVKGTI